jgi:hypothetical protein
VVVALDAQKITDFISGPQNDRGDFIGGFHGRSDNSGSRQKQDPFPNPEKYAYSLIHLKEGVMKKFIIDAKHIIDPATAR